MTIGATTKAVHRAPPSTCRHLVFYDASCSFCRSLLARFGLPFQRVGFDFRPLQTADGPFPAEEFMREMKLRRADGSWFGGADAWAEMLKAIWWLRPLGVSLGLPGLRHLARLCYRLIAENRHCLNGACHVRQRPPRNRWLPLVILPSLSFLLRPLVPDWIFMWLLAFALFAGCKWLTFRDSRGTEGHPTGFGAFIYLFLWPGMNARHWQSPPKDASDSWINPTLRILLGFSLLWATTHGLPTEPLARGWAGMIGVILILHFGLFHLLAIVWHNRGYNAPPLMLSPLRAGTVSEFWGRRWNRAFHDLAVQYLFTPMRQLFGARMGIMIAFFVSGLLHELVITVPARGGFGGPSLYFLLQGFGMLLEKSRPGAFLGMGRGLPGKLWTILIAALPLPLLFPPVFVERIILPMLKALGAYWD